MCTNKHKKQSCHCCNRQVATVRNRYPLLDHLNSWIIFLSRYSRSAIEEITGSEQTSRDKYRHTDTDTHRHRQTHGFRHGFIYYPRRKNDLSRVSLSIAATKIYQQFCCFFLKLIRRRHAIVCPRTYLHFVFQKNQKKSYIFFKIKSKNLK
jgi:hypothetical protein